METRIISLLNKEISRIGLGTWAIGGFLWGGTDEKESIRTILAALEKGINLIDTAPAYGFGLSEELVGKAVAEYGNRDKVNISTKAGLDWDDGKIFRNSSQPRILLEVEQSLKRLKTDYIDIYFIHWPDPSVPIEATAETMSRLYREGKIRAIGVSNYSPKQIEAFRQAASLNVTQSPFNIFEREIERDILPYSQVNGIALMAYGVLCRGLLTGRMREDTEFPGDDLRNEDPKFKPPKYRQYLAAVEELDQFARANFGKRVIHLAARWVLDKGADIALWGAREPGQLDAMDEVSGWKLDDDSIREVERIVKKNVDEEVEPEFISPPPRT